MKYPTIECVEYFMRRAKDAIKEVFFGYGI